MGTTFAIFICAGKKPLLKDKLHTHTYIYIYIYIYIYTYMSKWHCCAIFKFFCNARLQFIPPSRAIFEAGDNVYNSLVVYRYQVKTFIDCVLNKIPWVLPRFWDNLRQIRNNIDKKLFRCVWYLFPVFDKSPISFKFLCSGSIFPFIYHTFHDLPGLLQIWLVFQQ